ncbi:MAG: TRAP transporter substrate-binding protein [Rhodospirillaceae bacterium]|nr:TRAP transporter substrate-binding protein [Rhodospirillaceae bacterium]
MFKSLKSAAVGVLALGLISGVSTFANAAETITLKLHHLLPPVSFAHKGMLVPWAEKVMKESGGRLNIEIYPAMQLGGTPPQLADQARDGVVDIVWTLPGYTPGRFTKTEVFELPFMHTNTVATNLALSDYVKRHGDEYKDYKLISVFVHAGQVFHSHDPIRTVEDLKGLKIRTPTRTGGWMIEAMGATPVGAPVPKIPEMLSKKIVDAVLIPYEVTMPLKTFEMVDYHTTLGDPAVKRVNTSTFMIAMNKAKYDSLPADLQKVIDDNSGENIARWLGEIWGVNAEAPGEAKAKESGELIVMSADETAKLRTMTEGPVTERWVKEMEKNGIDGQALVNEARALLDKYSK